MRTFIVEWMDDDQQDTEICAEEMGESGGRIYFYAEGRSNIIAYIPQPENVRMVYLQAQVIENRASTRILTPLDFGWMFCGAEWILRAEAVNLSCEEVSRLPAPGRPSRHFHPRWVGNLRKGEPRRDEQGYWKPDERVEFGDLGQAEIEENGYISDWLSYMSNKVPIRDNPQG